MTQEEPIKFAGEPGTTGMGDGDGGQKSENVILPSTDVKESFSPPNPPITTPPAENKIIIPEANKSGFEFKETVKKLSVLKQHPKFKYILAGVFLALIVVFSFIKFGPEKVEISEFEMTASISDAAGISPDSVFTLRSTADLDESVVKDYLKVEPNVEFDVDKKDIGVFEIKPKEKLPENKIFALMIDAGPIADKPFSWAYQVKAPFQVISTLPRDKATSVPLNSGVEIVLNRENFSNLENYFEINPRVSGRFEVHRSTVAFVPTQQLEPETVYTVTVKRGVSVQGSNDVLNEDRVFRFETAPDYDVYSYFDFGRTFWEFKQDIEPAFEINYYQMWNVSNLPTKVYRFNNAEEFINAYKGTVFQDFGWSRFNRAKPYSGPDDKKIFDGNLSVENQFDIKFMRLPQKLDGGFYLIDVLVDNEHKQTWFQVTGLANYSATSGTQSLIWLRNIDGNQPAADAEIFFEGGSVGRTNSDGVAQFNTPQALIHELKDSFSYYNDFSPSFYILKYQDKETVVPVVSRYGDFSKVSTPDQWWDYLSFDKTVYQPSDTLRFWGIVKQRNGTDIKGEELVIQLTDPFWYGTSPADTTIYAQAKANVSDFYTVTGEMNFSGLKPGMYQLNIRRGNEIIISENINVEAYIKPAYRLLLTPNKNAVFAGDTVNFKVRAEFFDGTPVSNLAVKYTGYLNGTISGNVKLNSDGEGSFDVRTEYVARTQFGAQYLGVTVSPTV
ncbi:MAG: Ig-like domain-containing protein, partial [bacterium]|nr:Ig-like domain-containing protein [bacterium]